MLEPQTRMALTEQLAPPPGFELIHAVGTTFTLDLETALSVPLSFASRRITAEDGELGIFEALRRSTEKVDIFAQAGALSAGTQSKLVAFLEAMVHPVTHPSGLFHPKVWFLEYGNDDDECVYRFLCASRNLTSDRSWDVILRLDGEIPDDRDSAEAREMNASLVELLRALPTMAVHPLGEDRRARVDALAERWSEIVWENPPGLELLEFHVFGLQVPPEPDLEGSQALVISPFVSGEQLDTMRAGVTGHTILLSRADSLDQLEPASLTGRIETRVLYEMADEDAVQDQGSERLVGLHAKVVVVDYHHSSRMFLGSANATVAGWGHNVEVMVELEGRRRTVGTKAVLEAMGELVEDYPTEGGGPADPSEDVRWMLDGVLRELAALRLTVTVTGSGPYELRVTSADPVPGARDNAAGAPTVRWRPLRHSAEYEISELGGEGGVITNVALAEVTPFIEFIARHADGTTRRTLALAHLEGDPPDRGQAIIAEQLTSREALVQLLRLMLELTRSGSAGSWIFDRRGQFAGAGVDPGSGVGLFEALLRAVAVGHEGLEEVRKLIDYLSRHAGDDAVVPEGFESLWAAVWSAHELAGGESS
ncbi:phospholipase D family protein [Dietzia natronolimnaea]|nr:phospholipase D family protein [Dietzia natronolimnaea]